MSSTVAYTEIKNHLATTFSGVYQILDYDQIEPALEQGTDPMVVLEEVGGLETLVAFGDNTSLEHREDGTLNVYCMTPAPESIAAARLIAENIANSLRLQHLNGVRIRAVSPPAVESANDGLWTIGSMTVSFDLHTPRARP